MRLTPKEKITRARVKLQDDTPFFSYLVMTLEPIEMKKAGTMGVDYEGHLYFNPDWVDDLDLEKIKGSMCHEALHLALEHLLRRGDRDKMLWNFATDYVINSKVKQNGFRLPSGVLHDTRFKDMSSEEVYDELIDKAETKKVRRRGQGNSGQEVSGGSGGGGEGEEQSGGAKEKGDEGNGEGEEQDKSEDEGKGGGNKEEKDKESGDEEDEFGELSEEEKQRKRDLEKKLNGEQFDKHIEPEDKNEEVNNTDIEKEKQKWKRKLVEAYHHSQNRGKTPSGMETIIEDILDEKLDWKSILHRFIQKEVPYDFTYSRPHKKSKATGFYMPDVKRESFEICVAVDTSGSISDKRLQEFLSEIVGIYRSFQNVRMTVIVADAKVQETYELKNGNVDRFKDIELKGRGGTDHKCVFKWIDQNKANARVVVALTDGFSSFPSNTTARQTLWVVPETGAKDSKFPFGRVLRLPSA